MRKCRHVAAAASAVVAGAVLAWPAVAASTTSSPTSPVNLATPIDFGAAIAAPAGHRAGRRRAFRDPWHRSDPDGVSYPKEREL